MAAIVLESKFGSQYEDAPGSYEFQGRYLRFFEPLSRGEPLFAVIYEPRGSTGGQMAYVGLAEVIGVPVEVGRRNRTGELLWRVAYRWPVETFDNPVPREVLGEPIESWLKERPRGRLRNVATLGRAVRALLDEDFERILRFAGVNPLVEESLYPLLDHAPEALVSARERVERIVSVYGRRAAFRRDVLAAYRFRCAITGLGLGHVATTKSHGVLDAAHIRPVAASGLDVVSNGVSLTPTLHRLFDQGLFTMKYGRGGVEVVASPRLQHGMVEVPERGVSLSVRSGVHLILPEHPSEHPDRAYLEYHARNIFVDS